MRITLASDGSEGSLAAARSLSLLPWPADSSVQVAVAADEEGEETLSRTRAALGRFAGSITTTLLPGGGTHAVVKALLTAAAAFEADLIVAGASGHSALERFFLGSVAESLARHASLPILIVRAPLNALRRIVMGVDGSDLARAAAGWALERLPLEPDCRVELVRIVPAPPAVLPSEPYYAPAVLERVEELLVEEERTAWSYVRELAGQLAASNRYSGLHCEGEAAVGNPGEELVRRADEPKSDLIVVGSHGRGGFSLFPMGSIAERVLRHAPCSVLVVPERRPASAEADPSQEGFAFT